MRLRLCLPLLLIPLALLCGCGQANMAPVKGRVTFKGKPVAQASLIFAPVQKSDEDKEPGKPGTGFTDADGNFVLSSYKPHDGAVIGQHRVTVTVDDTNPVRCKRQSHLTVEVKPGDNDLPIELKE
jgi:hypothetical protein